MAKKTYTLKNVSELVEAFSGGYLYGYTPSESYDANTFVYPIKVTADTEAKTFVVVDSSKKQETISSATTNAALSSCSSSKAKWYQKPWAIIALVAGVAIVVAVIFYNV